MNIASIVADIKETDTIYVVIAIVVILMFWGLAKIGRKNK